MNKNDYQQLRTLYSALQQRCREVGKKLKKLNWVYGDEYAEYSPCGDEIECRAFDKWDYEYYTEYFPAYFLWSTDEEIDQYVSDELRKIEEKEMAEKQRQAEKELREKQAQYEKLKKELGL